MKKIILVWLVVLGFASFMVGEVLPATVTIDAAITANTPTQYKSLSIDQNGNVTITTVPTTTTGNSIIGQVYVTYTGGLGAKNIGIPNVTVQLNGASQTATDLNGFYTFLGLSGGNYTVTATSATLKYTFSAVGSSTVTVPATPQTVNFVATPTSIYTISGNVKDKSAANFQGVTMGFWWGSTQLDNQDVTDSSGNYSITPVGDGITYTITPVLSGHTFSPASLNVTVTGGNVTGQNFVEQSKGQYSDKVAIAVPLNKNACGDYGYMDSRYCQSSNSYPIAKGQTVWFLIDPVSFGVASTGTNLSAWVRDYNQGIGVGLLQATVYVIDPSDNLIWKEDMLMENNWGEFWTTSFKRGQQRFLISVTEFGRADTPTTIIWICQ